MQPVSQNKSITQFYDHFIQWSIQKTVFASKINHLDANVHKHDDVIKWKHFPRYWPFVRGIHRSPVNPPLKGQWRGALMFSFICIWINGWVNNREAGDLRLYRTHYDLTVMRYDMEMLSALLTLSEENPRLSVYSPYEEIVMRGFDFLRVSMNKLSWWRHQMDTFSAGVTGHLCGEFTGPRWIPHTKASDAELWCLLWSASE